MIPLREHLERLDSQERKGNAGVGHGEGSRVACNGCRALSGKITRSCNRGWQRTHSNVNVLGATRSELGRVLSLGYTCAFDHSVLKGKELFQGENISSPRARTMVRSRCSGFRRGLHAVCATAGI